MSMNTNDTEKPYKAYVYAVREQLEQQLSLLDQLSQLASANRLTGIERSATERNLQLLVEVALGCSKHYLKSQTLPVPSESAMVIRQVYSVLTIENPLEQEMIGAVGMRNAIIHDYLNLDWDKVSSVLTQKKYHQVAKYCERLLKELMG